MILYGVHLEALGFAQYAHWVYVLRNPHLASSPIDSRTARGVTARILFGPVVFAVAIVLALFSPQLGYALYYAVLIAYVFTALRDRTVLR